MFSDQTKLAILGEFSYQHTGFCNCDSEEVDISVRYRTPACVEAEGVARAAYVERENALNALLGRLEWEIKTTGERILTQHKASHYGPVWNAVENEIREVVKQIATEVAYSRIF